MLFTYNETDYLTLLGLFETAELFDCKTRSEYYKWSNFYKWSECYRRYLYNELIQNNWDVKWEK